MTPSAPAVAANPELELALAAVLGAVALLTLPWLLRHAARALAGSPAPAAARWTSAFTLLAAVGLQLLLVQGFVVTSWAGYLLAPSGAALTPDVAHGAAATALYGPLLRAMSGDLGVVVAVNVVLGLLSLPLAASVATRLAGHWSAGAIAMVLLALHPLLLHDRASESTIVPATFFLLGAALHFDAWLQRGSNLDAAALVAHGALALTGRPEMLLALPLLLGALAALPGTRSRRADPGIAVTLAGLIVLLAVPRLLNVPAMLAAGPVQTGGAGERFLTHNALWDSTVHSPGQTLLMFAAVALAPRGRRLAVGLVVTLVLGWQAAGAIGMPRIGMPRPESVALLFAAVAAAVAVARLFAMPDRAAHVAAVACLLLALVPTRQAVERQWTPTEASAFDSFWSQAIAKAPAVPGTRCLARLAASDGPTGLGPRVYPDAEAAAGAGSLQLLSLAQLAAGVESDGARCQSTLLLTGPQCWQRPAALGAEAQPPEHPACAAVRERYQLTPIETATMQIHGPRDSKGDRWSAEVPIGLFELVRSPVRL